MAKKPMKKGGKGMMAASDRRPAAEAVTAKAETKSWGGKGKKMKGKC